jgi:hypothetical protein
MERKTLRNLLELTQRVQSADRRQATVEELQWAMESVQKTMLDRMEEVPAMFNHDRIAVGDIDEL